MGKNSHLNNQSARKYHFDLNYFKELNAKKAYILGYIFAEGSMHNPKGTSYSIRLESCDKDILEFINLDFKIPLNSRKRNNRRKLTYYIIICSKDIYICLKKYFVNDKHKSATIQLPIIDISIMPYFIRGYFEGDGYVNKNGRLHTVTLTSASILFLKQISQFLYKHLEIETNLYKYKYRDYWKLHFNQKSSISFLKWIYSGEIFVKSQKYLDYNNSLNLLNLPIKKRARNLLGLDTNLIKTLYQQGYGTYKIGRYFNCSPQTIKNRLEDMGIKMRPFSFYVGKFHQNIIIGINLDGKAEAKTKYGIREDLLK